METTGRAIAPDWARVLGLLRGWMAKFNIVPGVSQLVFNAKMTVGLQYTRSGERPMGINDGAVISYGSIYNCQDWMRIEQYFVDCQRCSLKFLLNEQYDHAIPEVRTWTDSPKQTAKDFGCVCGRADCQGVGKFRTQNVCAFV